MHRIRPSVVEMGEAASNACSETGVLISSYRDGRIALILLSLKSLPSLKYGI